MSDETQKSIPSRIIDELGFSSLVHAPSDVFLLLFTRFIRMFAYGSSSLVLALYLAELGHSDIMIGLFMTLTLAGDVLISLCLTIVADQVGRRRILTLGGILMVFSGVIFASCGNYWVLLIAAVVGVISASGNEIGPFRAVEESTLAHLVEANARSDIFAFYVVVGTLGGAGGSLVGGWLTQALQHSAWGELNAYRFIFWLYAAIGIFKIILASLLSADCEVQDAQSNGEENETDERTALLQTQDTTEGSSPRVKPKTAMEKWRLSKKTALLLARLCALFFFDSLGSGMVPNSLIAYFIWRKFGLLQGKLGSIIAVAQFVASIGNIFASTISKRIGPVKTMVCTHLPSAVFLALLPLPTSLVLTIILLVARSSLSSMDQAPRSAFLSAVVLSHERTAVMGIVNTVKTLSQSLGPIITGALASHGDFWVAFIVAGSMKVLYDVGLLALFMNVSLEQNKPGDAASLGSTRDGSGTAAISTIERVDEESSNGTVGHGVSGESNATAPLHHQ